MHSELEVELGTETGLAQLRVGELSVEEARTLLQHILVEQRASCDPNAVYSALRGWTGRALRGSASSANFREWYNLVRAVGAQLGSDDSEWSVRFTVLAELIYERAGMAETMTPEMVLSRRHARALLAALAASEWHQLARDELGKRLGLEQANLTRVCTMLVDAGLVSRHADGRAVSLILTSAGAAVAPREAQGKQGTAIS